MSLDLTRGSIRENHRAVAAKRRRDGSVQLSRCWLTSMAGVPVAMYAIDLIGRPDTDLDWLRYLPVRPTGYNTA